MAKNARRRGGRSLNLILACTLLLLVAALIAAWALLTSRANPGVSSAAALRGVGSEGLTSGIGFFIEDGQGRKICTITHIVKLKNLAPRNTTDLIKITGAFSPIDQAPRDEKAEKIECAPAQGGGPALELAYQLVLKDTQASVITPGEVVSVITQGYEYKELTGVDVDGSKISSLNLVLVAKAQHYLPKGTSGAPLLVNGRVVGVLVGGNATTQLNYFTTLAVPAP